VLEMAQLPKMRPRTKHLCVRLHHFREHVWNGKISIQHIDTEDQIADMSHIYKARHTILETCVTDRTEDENRPEEGEESG